jgi:predicted metal-dependent HD superfamily phosphohydrolase
MSLAMQQHQQENSIDDAARFHDDFHHYTQHHDNEANEAKYRVFLDSRSIPAQRNTVNGPEMSALYYS